MALGFRRDTGWMAVFIHDGPNGDTVTFIVYVDDLVMLGGPRMLKIIEAVREQIEMDDPAELQKYLGVHHAKEVVQSSGHELTTYAFEMRGYFNAIGERFIKETGLKLTNVSTPNAPDLPVEDFILLHEKPGNLERSSRSHSSWLTCMDPGWHFQRFRLSFSAWPHLLRSGPLKPIGGCIV